ncbi:MAG: cyclase family protein [Actinobacteria bacterium]|nr:MAG: cyclase family protein [Actinomycetota bacterium]
MAKFIDCSHLIENGMTTYPGLPGPNIGEHLSRADSRSHYQEGTEFQIGTISMVANTGTYLDTPFHRYAEGHDLADLPLTKVANLEGICISVEGPRIEAEVLNDHDLSGCAVLFHTGWDRYWGTERYGSAEHPYLGEEAIELLVRAGAGLVGIDSVNIDDTSGGSRPAHSRFLGAGIPIVEHLTGLGQLAGSAFRFFAVPPKVRSLGTFPVRAFAILD